MDVETWMTVVALFLIGTWVLGVSIARYRRGGGCSWWDHETAVGAPVSVTVDNEVGTMRRISIARIAVLTTILVPGLLILWIHLSVPRYPHNSREWLKWKYGADDEYLCKLAETLGVKCEDISSYGESPFPMNCFEQKFRQIRERKGFVSKADAEAAILGYEARWGANPVYYFYYNTDLCLGRRGDQEPLVLKFFYDGPRDESGRPLSEPWSDGTLMLDYWYDVEIWDSNFEVTKREMCEEGIGRVSE